LSKGTHVIHTYSVASNAILCVCGTVTKADNPDGTPHEEWIAHKNWGREHPFKAIKKTESLFTKYHRKRIERIKEAEAI